MRETYTLTEKILFAAAGSFLLAAAGLGWGVPGDALMKYTTAEVAGMLVGMTVMFFAASVGVILGVRLVCGIAEYIADCAELRLMRREERYVNRAVVCRAAGRGR